MRRILVPYLSGIFLSSKTKFFHDFKVSLWQPANVVATKQNIFQKNEFRTCVQLLWKAIFKWNPSQWPQSWCPHKNWIPLQFVWQVFQEQNKVEVPHNFKTCRKGSFPVWHQICWDPMNLCTILRQTVTWGPTIKEYMKRNQPGNESIWDKARLSNKWQKDDDPKYQEETAEYDGAPQQVWLEINILMYNNRFYLVKALDPSLIIVRMKTDILIHWF